MSGKIRDGSDRAHVLKQLAGFMNDLGVKIDGFGLSVEFRDGSSVVLGDSRGNLRSEFPGDIGDVLDSPICKEGSD